jgi:glutaredoxin
MVKVQIVTTKSCPYCPSAKRLWQEVKKEKNFDYQEVDAFSDEGRDLVEKFGIMTVPTTIIDGKVAFTGVPEKNKAVAAVSK